MKTYELHESVFSLSHILMCIVLTCSGWFVFMTPHLSCFWRMLPFYSVFCHHPLSNGRKAGSMFQWSSLFCTHKILLGAGDEVNNIAKAQVTFVELHELIWNTIDSVSFSTGDSFCVFFHIGVSFHCGFLKWLNFSSLTGKPFSVWTYVFCFISIVHLFSF